MRPFRIALLTAVVCTLTACKSRPQPTPQAPFDPATVSQVQGTITLSGTPPPPTKIDTSMDPTCNPSGGPDPVAEQYVVHHGKLANVFVYVKSGPPAAMSSPRPVQQPVVMDQKGCIYIPHVVAVMVGGTVEFHNDDAGMHNIETMPQDRGNQRIDTSQGPHGAPKTATFNAPETMIPVRCNMHPWMNAFINVSATPFYAVSSPQGTFTLNGLPPGDYVLGAVHETLGEQTLHLTVKPHATAQADLTFTMH